MQYLSTYSNVRKVLYNILRFLCTTLFGVTVNRFIGKERALIYPLATESKKSLICFAFVRIVIVLL